MATSCYTLGCWIAGAVRVAPVPANLVKKLNNFYDISEDIWTGRAPPWIGVASFYTFVASSSTISGASYKGEKIRTLLLASSIATWAWPWRAWSFVLALELYPSLALPLQQTTTLAVGAGTSTLASTMCIHTIYEKEWMSQILIWITRYQLKSSNSSNERRNWTFQMPCSLSKKSTNISYHSIRLY